MNRPSHILVLGAGTSGLALGYYAKRSLLPFTIYEACERVGGNATTFRHGEFLFDSGAHRFHDRDGEVTQELRKLMGGSLRKVEVPSKICENGKLIDFPLSVLDVLTKLGPRVFGRAASELVRSRLRKRGVKKEDFESFAVRSYGAEIAGRFLLNYSEKLWGIPCRRLSHVVAGRRLRGLDPRSLFIEALFGRKNSVRHIDGSFYYPKAGIGAIPEALAESCGRRNIITGVRVTRVLHNSRRITAIGARGGTRPVRDEIVSTLPIPVFVDMMEPPPPEDISLAARRLRFRNVILAAVFIKRQSVLRAATVYFPGADFPFTRVSEPKNRSLRMGPLDRTALVAEIPCEGRGKPWDLDDDELTRLVSSSLVRLRWMRQDEVIGGCVERLGHAYPVLEIGFETEVQKIMGFLKRFINLKVVGRNGMFTYASIHDALRFGKDTVAEYLSRSA